ncbi:MAG: NifB/NifX family molybdenum-iron cluster-binding protein [Anaerolineae bacterium]|nr:NifB/NifX family molybdenum-iron cluster-binding protein [Anaerolineae bacterium]
MKVIVTANGTTLESPASPIFGRCPTFILVDTETMQYQAIANPALSAGGGAGIQAAQFVVDQGAQTIVTGNVGPNAFGVLQAAGLSVYVVKEGTVQQAIEAYKAGQLSVASGATGPSHAGMGRGAGRGMGQGRRGQ